MPLIQSIDPVARRIYLSIDTVGASFDPVDIYKEMRTLRQNDETLRPFVVFLEAKGRDFKGLDSQGNDKFTEKYVVCINGTRIVPYDSTHGFTVTGVIITDTGQEGVACFDKTLLTPGTAIDISYQPPQVEVIEIRTGVADATEIGQAVWEYTRP